MRKRSIQELNRKTPEAFKTAAKIPLILILDNVRSLYNIGAVFRTADAFLVDKIFLCGITACPPHKDIHKTALGATETVAWEYCKHTEDLVSKLLQQNIEVVAVEQTDTATPLNHFKPEPGKRYAFVLGNEVKGVRQEVINLLENSVEIPQFGTKHSLNIAVAASIVLWDFFSKTQFLKTL